MSDEFYVGYHVNAPQRLSRLMRSTSFALVVAALAAALTLALAQAPFDRSRFEFGSEKAFRGLLVMTPYPTLFPASGEPPYLLVAPGKHGASELASPFSSQTVEIQGSLIENGRQRAIEVSPAALRPIGAGVAPSVSLVGDVVLEGEIVDTKCYYGVMNPGRGKVHRDCAVRCISGGVPPGLLVRDRTGNLRAVLLAREDGRELHEELLDFVAEPVRISGTLHRSGEQLILHARLATLTRIATGE